MAFPTIEHILIQLFREGWGGQKKGLIQLYVFYILSVISSPKMTTVGLSSTYSDGS